MTFWKIINFENSLLYGRVDPKWQKLIKYLKKNQSVAPYVTSNDLLKEKTTNHYRKVDQNLIDEVKLNLETEVPQ